MNALRCQGCAAPLPEAPAGQPLRCPFCGLVHHGPAGGAVRVGAVSVERAGPSRIPRWVGVLVGLIVVATIVPAAIGLFVAWRAAEAVAPAVRSVVDAMPGKRALTPADLATAPRGFHDLDIAPPPGGYGAIDAVAAVPWALAVAQAWAPDARLVRVDVQRVRPDGTLNVQDDGEASLTYRFVSPARVGAAREQARLQASAESAVEMWVRVKAGEPQAFINVTPGRIVRDEPAPPHPKVMALPELFARPPVRRAHEGLPFLQGYLIHLEREGWVWYFSSLANESKPRVRARDGAVWPYGR